MVSLNVSALLFFCRAHTLVSKKSMDASCSNPISRQIEIQVSGLQVYIFDYQPLFGNMSLRSSPSNLGAKTSHKPSFYTAVFDLGLL